MSLKKGADVKWDWRVRNNDKRRDQIFDAFVNTAIISSASRSAAWRYTSTSKVQTVFSL
jgi:hypothetical protein